MNAIRLYTLTYKETYRFLKVWMQTVFSPVVIAVMYFAVFGGALSSRIVEFNDIPYLAFIVPGLALLQATTNAFQNPSSSLIIAQYQGLLPDLLMSPLTAMEKTLGYLLGGVIRGVMVTLLIFGVAAFFVRDFWPEHWLALAAITFLANGTFSLMGTLVGIWSKTFDGVAGITTFVITPMAFLGGVFYSINALPEFARILSHANPFFYYVDATRWAFFGVSDIAPAISFSVALGFFLFFFACVYIAFATDWRMKS